MNNIIRSQLLLCKKRAWIIAGCMLIPMLFLFLFLSTNETTAEGIADGSMISLIFTAMLPAMLITYCYAERIQMYEIMAGYRPHKIILGRVVVFLPFTIISLIGFTVMSLIFDSSTETVVMLVLFGVLTFRTALGIIFLSPLFKESAFAPIVSVMLLMVYSSAEELAHSPVSFLAFGQSVLLNLPVTVGYIIKVITSAVVSCVVYYLIGYFTLKMKIDLQPHF